MDNVRISLSSDEILSRMDVVDLYQYAIYHHPFFLFT